MTRRYDVVECTLFESSHEGNHPPENTPPPSPRHLPGEAEAGKSLNPTAIKLFTQRLGVGTTRPNAFARLS